MKITKADAESAVLISTVTGLTAATGGIGTALAVGAGAVVLNTLEQRKNKKDNKK